jgi:CBS domain-containing protein
MPVRARDVMQAKVRTVHPTLSLTDLEDLLIAERISGAPVVENGEVVGIVSRSDVVRVLALARSLGGLAAQGDVPPEYSPGEVPEPQGMRTEPRRTVRDAMAADPVTVAPDTPIREVARLLVDRHLHRVLVAEGKKLLGLVTSTDLVRLIAEGRLREA